MLKQTNHKLPEAMIDRLRRESEESGVPQSVMIRRAIQAYLDRIDVERKRNGCRPMDVACTD